MALKNDSCICWCSDQMRYRTTSFWYTNRRTVPSEIFAQVIMHREPVDTAQLYQPYDEPVRRVAQLQRIEYPLRA